MPSAITSRKPRVIITLTPTRLAPSEQQVLRCHRGLPPPQVIKGCWQLSGGHKGEKTTDRTGGAAAVEDFDRFVSAGVTTLDAADHYGPAEDLIGR